MSDPTPVDGAALLAALRGPSPNYKRDAMQAAVDQRDAFIPHLVTYLHSLADEPRTDPDDLGPCYAITLAAHLRATEAHDALVRIARSHNDLAAELFGDAWLEDAGEVLFHTCGGQLDGLWEVLDDYDAHEFNRAGAANALTLAVVAGLIDREMVADALAERLAPDAAPNDAYFYWSGVVEALITVGVDSHVPAMRDAVASGLAEVWGGNTEALEREMITPIEERLRRAGEMLERADPEDIHGRMRWWASFEENAPPAGSPGGSASRPSSTTRPAPRGFSPPRPVVPPRKNRKKKKRRR